jgi:MSHA biogenesis protein MshI
LFFKLLKRNDPTRAVGLDLYDDGYALVVLEQDRDTPRVASAQWCGLDDAAALPGSLRDAVRACGARGLPVYATLRHASYSLVQLEAPELPDDELRDAMQWRVGDLIDFPVEEAIIDVFRLPDSRRPGAPALVYAVVARRSDVDGLAAALDDAGLEIAAIDIVEMAIRNLALHVDVPGRPRAYLHLRPGQTVIEIVDGPQVFLSRRVLQDYDVDADPVILQAQMEGLALEVQRSLDYFESQYALGAADRLSVLVSDDVVFDAFNGVAQSFLTVQTTRFDLDRVAIHPGIALDDLSRGVAAVGAAMRSLPWAA